MSSDGNSGGKDDDGPLVAEYALGLLDAGGHEAMAARLRDDAALRAELAFWRQRLASLDADFAEIEPPADALTRLERRLFAPPLARAGLWDNLAFWRSLAGVGLAIAALSIGFSLLRPAPLAPADFAAQLVAALEEDGSNARFVALYDPQTGAVRLTVLSGQAMADKDYELWYIRGSDAPVSMGVIPASGRAEMQADPKAMAQIDAGTVLAVTLEPKGGSPTGNPTGPVMAKGAATQI